MFIPRIPDFGISSLKATIAQANVTSFAMLGSSADTGDSCDDIHHCRTFLQIFWSCISVLVACTWVSVHPNLPGPNEGFWRILWRRISLMIVALIAPEMLVLWAARQWYAARKLTRRCKGWTETHAHFALMGGFALFDGSDFNCILRCSGDPRPPDDSLESYIDLISLFKAEEIQDRSHSDALAKFLAIGQTGWFVVQLVARRVENLSITVLEIMTVAFAAMNVMIYIFWWNKPQGVRYPIHIQNQNRNNNLDDVKTSPTPEPQPDTLEWLLNIITNDLIWFNVKFESAGMPLKIFLCVAFPAIKFFVIVINVVFDEDPEVDPLDKISSFERVVKLEPSWHQDKVIAYSAAMIFGAIHCAAWAFIFPTQVEQTLWRIFSLIVTFVPLALICTDLWKDKLDGHIENIVSIILCFVVFFYVLARLGLIVQAFLALRSLPTNSFAIVEWVNFLPHI
ncbi:uncharacterized protein C8R40DRAFT_336780 [Lentinula edodes]|uniref:uncharacterized protein n=1 Tax=Lentinula edodes TaxID=5353 RepID=UPI001E8EC14A|nr:uncharacterized protein C8R40DRAFT_336780 [Lentinula edodes]KAH7873936.1 hypothetical protein C8R40DRAFT_336780 [Lentinula edodes]